jgi:glyoxylase-like metal-dependent hydrolase (beta-lactamase superfamily II)
MSGALYLRVNGMGNAWPVPLGQEHPFYSGNTRPDYANASFSLLWLDAQKQAGKDILVDAGHGIVPFLLQNGNRIPDATVITHPHFDHILGLDWIVQSYYRFHDHQPYPVYATRGCRNQILQVFPHLKGLTDFRELRYGEPEQVVEVDGLKITAFPVYHGLHARGAAMILFHWKPAECRVLFTGDLLFPMIHKTDLRALQKIDWLVTDANNRFPYPKSNHWSIVHNKPEDEPFLSSFFNNLKRNETGLPHHHLGYTEYTYLLDWYREFPDIKSSFLNLFDFIHELLPLHMIFTHYSGLEDWKYYHQPVLTRQELLHWGVKQLTKSGMDTLLHIPETGEILPVFPR